LAEALNKARRFTRAQWKALQEEQGRPQARTHICVQQRGDLKLVPVDDICYFMADQKYISVRYPQGEMLIEESLKSLEQEFEGRFIRIHRNALVALKDINGMARRDDGHYVVSLSRCPDTLEISRRHLPEIRKLLKGQ
jgi:two-component system response regulator AlgR